MVYSGVPSRGCAPCRARKTKCDHSVPSCGQCLRVRRDCFGYRDGKALLFRDETKKVMTKAQAVERFKRSTLPDNTVLDEDSNISRGSDTNSAFPQGPVPVSRHIAPRSLSIPLEEEATFFFFHNFVSTDPEIPKGSLNYLPTLYKQGLEGSPLPGIIASIGMASIANMRNAPDILIAAQRKHMLVLHVINATLQDLEKAKTDTTLMVVMLLGLFENVTCSSPQSMKSWASHISGATEIARVRGREQLQTELGRRMFIHLRAQIVVDCLQRRRVVPQMIIDWSEIVAESEPDQWPEHRLFQIIVRLCTLRSVTKAQRNESPAGLTTASSIDADLADWANLVPWEYAYMTRTDGKPDDLLCGYYHVYKNIRIAIIWNTYRTARIIANNIKVAWLTYHSPSTIDAARLRASEAIITQLTSDICTSVPFHLGKNGLSESSSLTPKAAAGQSLLWPLYVAATADEVSSSTQAWIVSQLDKIGNIMGIQQATSLANVLRMKKEIMIWDRMTTNRVTELLLEEEDDW